MPDYYAHSTESKNKDDWQPLSRHLEKVAGLARSFANDFGAGVWGEISGFLHDAGKATHAFQRRLEGNLARVDHSTFGARISSEKYGVLGLLLAYVIAGHHGGLPDGGEQEGQLHYRLKHGKVPEDVELLPEIDFPRELLPPFKSSRDRGGFSLSFFTRMLFSCLVDADFLDTEDFCDPEKADFRLTSAATPLFVDLKDSLDKHLSEKLRDSAKTLVNKWRQSILAQCREKARMSPGFFSLTVPTGGGKTFSSLAFALEHLVANAAEFGLRRIVYAIPFTSIIEQNARIFQDILGREHVLEHQCNYKESDDPEDHVYNRRRGLAAENWDAPVVVTTNVQFFESLFSNKPSRCRKLHNIARSIIVLDEAQAIPTEYLEPCLAALRELVEHYGCTVLLCTATQPALDDKSSLRMALPSVTEIVEDPSRLYQELSRTKVEFIGKLSDDVLAERLRAESQALCILPTKPQTKAVFEQLRGVDGLFHLSTNMYPEHRRQVLDEIRICLNEDKPCRVISTSLVEAGVDLDFPVVYRAMAGLDSIAQAAGRCNREGGMESKGKVFVFDIENLPSMPWLKRCMSRAAETLRALPNADPLGLEAMRRYFELLYDVQELDKKQVMARLNTLTRDLYFPFREVAGDFRFIEEESIGVIIPNGPKVEKLVQELRYVKFPRAIIRKLQQYSVGVRTREFAILDAAGALEMVREEFPVLRNLEAYREDIGLCLEGGEVWNCSDLIF
ncbi:CRISPR-associated endonuclease Cas3'' [Syntrophotalea acetylenica]|uniref:CRISPR-associated endonuclease Cas3'' n=1 Tax=Syntrophotalea acetylenica TaxID=29542 RepID=UPI002A3624A2|nr:CRISPR-associated endonuclease Cas3'' [Syntrophotalea acetylenica]MDY0263064.1 CRISPR-associated endonuclease Cas3'' [Syntrophotalea acetylenica]